MPVPIPIPTVTHTHDALHNGLSAPPYHHKERPMKRELLATASVGGSLDLQRVHSDALPKHQIARKVVYVETSGGSPTKSTVLAEDTRQEPDEILSDINSTAVEIGSSIDSGSHPSMSSVGANEAGSRSELNMSPSLPSVNEGLEPLLEHQEPWQPQHDTMAVSTGAASRPGKDDVDQSLRSHSDVQLTSRTEERKRQNASFDERCFSTTTKQTGFRASSEPPSSSTALQTASTGTQQYSLDNVHTASPQSQIDEIWREVEASSREDVVKQLPDPSPHQASEQQQEETTLAATETTHKEASPAADRCRETCTVNVHTCTCTCTCLLYNVHVYCTHSTHVHCVLYTQCVYLVLRT